MMLDQSLKRNLQSLELQALERAQKAHGQYRVQEYRKEWYGALYIKLN
jgi:hypothetical protein